MTRAEYSWSLPSAMADPELPGDRGGRSRRTVRDWAVDITAFLFAAGIGLLAAAPIDAGRTLFDGVVLVDSLIGAAACCSLWVRRRWPVGPPRLDANSRGRIASSAHDTGPLDGGAETGGIG